MCTAGQPLAAEQDVDAHQHRAPWQREGKDHLDALVTPIAEPLLDCHFEQQAPQIAAGANPFEHDGITGLCLQTCKRELKLARKRRKELQDG